MQTSHADAVAAVASGKRYQRAVCVRARMGRRALRTPTARRSVRKSPPVSRRRDHGKVGPQRRRGSARDASGSRRCSKASAARRNLSASSRTSIDWVRRRRPAYALALSTREVARYHALTTARAWPSRPARGSADARATIASCRCSRPSAGTQAGNRSTERMSPKRTAGPPAALSRQPCRVGVNPGSGTRGRVAAPRRGRSVYQSLWLIWLRRGLPSSTLPASAWRSNRTLGHARITSVVLGGVAN